ncbi:hypothetical protein [Nostocoides sp. HKS02]|uniref:hypothetical protein n=1 Tax=Nostocoides sp. HKS02 TaxID=1813880 RepID=UPI0012B44E64|nr:hypothetical protein [Tetrasphaera sp. HKS02]QGN57562.1 hypothetical protein GKE56_06390 [Tetrasphaera sp. HKS02]
MVEHERPPVGSVAEEVARLLEAVGGWASTAQATYAARPGPESGPEPGPESGPESETHTDPQANSARCSSCGAANGIGQAVVCQLCPVCQGIGLLRSVRPETVDRLADLAGVVATTLRDLATHHRETRDGGPDARPGASRVQDIRIEDDDEPDQQGQHAQSDRRGSAAP